LIVISAPGFLPLFLSSFLVTSTFGQSHPMSWLLGFFALSFPESCLSPSLKSQFQASHSPSFPHILVFLLLTYSSSVSSRAPRPPVQFSLHQFTPTFSACPTQLLHSMAHALHGFTSQLWHLLAASPWLLNPFTVLSFLSVKWSCGKD
jgi:hypothetical protein